MMRLATYQYQIEELSWVEYTRKIKNLVLDAKQKEADLVLMPEYAGYEIGGHHKNDRDLFFNIQDFLPDYLDFYKALSEEHEIYIQPGTLPVADVNDRFYNRAYLFGPDGRYDYQDKLQLIEYEKNSGIMLAGKHQTVFETAFGKIGIAICYDSEFPEIVRALVNAGAQLILVPSYTVTTAAYHRVAISARARAIENQCYVAVSFVVGQVSAGCEIPEVTTGKAAIFSPADVGFPDNGILIEGSLNAVEMIVGEIDFDKLSFVREHGHVRNFDDYKQLNKAEVKKVFKFN